ncbi:hypothetical protein [Ponticaulis koreensis]|uniref:hypothetical protein n=1 Tax=Ponticaulis koreensis TaxID=1123045 RepID=UPI0003B4FD64|nr:hypothetical protein [Ponticaulis koreensis]
MPNFILKTVTAAAFTAATIIPHAHAETREECRINVQENARLTNAVTVGGGLGTFAGVVGCSYLVSIAWIDAGASYLACTLAAAAVSTGVTVSSESEKVAAELHECERLPSRDETTTLAAR